MSVRRRLLLVDDEAEIVELLRMTFHDFEVEGALNVDSALDLLRTKPFDAMITDVRMPGQSGLSLIDRAVEIRPGIAVIVITGHHQEFAGDARVARWVAKPFSISGIRSTLLDVLDGRQDRSVTG
jgi:DNA-binding NtrC family response regulator